MIILLYVFIQSGMVLNNRRWEALSEYELQADGNVFKMTESDHVGIEYFVAQYQQTSFFHEYEAMEIFDHEIEDKAFIEELSWSKFPKRLFGRFYFSTPGVAEISILDDYSGVLHNIRKWVSRPGWKTWEFDIGEGQEPFKVDLYCRFKTLFNQKDQVILNHSLYHPSLFG